MTSSVIDISLLTVPEQMDAVWWQGPGQSITVDGEVDRKEDWGRSCTAVSELKIQGELLGRANLNNPHGFLGYCVLRGA